MIKLKLTILAATIAVAASITSSQAAFVTGSVGFTGKAVLNGPLLTATQVTTWTDTKVNGTTGDFTVIPDGTGVTFTQPWTFTSGASPFWTITYGGETIVFNLLTSTIHSQDSTAITVTGMGIASGFGNEAYDDTPMQWFFSTQGGVATFSAASVAVPEPSTVVAGALLLLPFGISTLRILRKNKNA